MPIVTHNFPAAGGVANPGYLEALELARQCVDQADINAGWGDSGISHGSCWAAVATTPTAAFTAPNAVNVAVPGGNGMAALPYGVVFGSSKMAVVGAGAAAVPGMPAAGFSGHAERNALVIAGGNGLALHAPNGYSVLFVQLHPCGHCVNWLNGAGAGFGLPNPYAALIAGGHVMHVWYRWAHTPAGCGLKDTWNLQPRGFKLWDINTNW
jgi:hypothetical protein